MTNSKSDFLAEYLEIQEQHEALTVKYKVLEERKDALDEAISKGLSLNHLIDKELIIVEEPSKNNDTFIKESKGLVEKGYFPRYGYLTNNVNPRNIGKTAKVFRVCLSRIETVDYENTSKEVKGVYLVWKLYANPMKNDGSYGNAIISTHLFDKLD